MKRDWKPKDLKKAFFNVDLTDLQVNLGFEWKKVKDYMAVVNLDEKNVICVVSRNYHLVTNEEAYNIGDYVKKQWEELKRKLICLRRIEMTSSMALPMFCRAFNVKIDRKSISPTTKKLLREKAKLVKKLSKDYFSEMGNNAYAIFNVLTDFATYPEYADNTSIHIHSYQKIVGRWADELIRKTSDDNNFSMTDFIGRTAQDNAYYMESLIENENR